MVSVDSKYNVWTSYSNSWLLEQMSTNEGGGSWDMTHYYWCVFREKVKNYLFFSFFELLPLPFLMVWWQYEGGRTPDTAKTPPSNGSTVQNSSEVKISSSSSLTPATHISYISTLIWKSFLDTFLPDKLCTTIHHAPQIIFFFLVSHIYRLL